MAKKSDWTPNDGEEALKSLIRATVMAAGPVDAATIPSKIRERIKGQATGDLDVDAYIKEILAETKGKR